MTEDGEDGAWTGPLAGLRVLDLTRVLAGPFTTQILANLGAEVLKVERPGKGDDIRVMAPFAPGGESHYFLGLNNNKKSLVIDLKTHQGVALIKQLAAHSDVLVENFRPGVMEKFGLDFDTLHALNPRLVMCSISGFGRSGPLKDMPSFDIVTQAFSGAMSVNGEPGGAPVKLGLPLGDMAGGVFGAPAILAALHERERTGRGRHIDISLMDGLMGMLGYQSQVYFITGKSPEPMGSAHAAIAPYGAFPASDGYVIVACLSDSFWHNFARALGREDLLNDPRFADPPGRSRHREELDGIINAIMVRETKAHWDAVLEEHDVPHAPILSVGDALEHPHAQARKMVETVQHPTAGAIRVVGRPIKFVGEEQAPMEAPPVLGADTRTALADVLGLNDEELDELTRNGAIDMPGRSG